MSNIEINDDVVIKSDITLFHFKYSHVLSIAIVIMNSLVGMIVEILRLNIALLSKVQF